MEHPCADPWLPTGPAFASGARAGVADEQEPAAAAFASAAPALAHGGAEAVDDVRGQGHDEVGDQDQVVSLPMADEERDSSAKEPEQETLDALHFDGLPVLDGLDIWTIYRRPADYPDVPYVVRHFRARATDVVAGDVVAAVDTLDEARTAIPKGLFLIPRAAADDPVIVESWL
jgi:hypothetical protein